MELSQELMVTIQASFMEYLLNIFMNFFQELLPVFQALMMEFFQVAIILTYLIAFTFIYSKRNKQTIIDIDQSQQQQHTVSSSQEYNGPKIKEPLPK